MTIEMKIKPKLEVLSRIMVLTHVVEELAKGFGVTGHPLKVIREGILKQYVKQVSIFYLDADGEKVGKVLMTIDWEKHTVCASTESGQSFPIDTKNSISEQISRVFPILVAHTKALRAHRGVKQLETRFKYTDEVRSDPQRVLEARKHMGTERKPNLEWAEMPMEQLKDKNYTAEIEYVSKMLEELRIVIQYDK